MNDRYRRNCSRLAWLVSRSHRKRVAESPLLEPVNSRSRPVAVVRTYDLNDEFAALADIGYKYLHRMLASSYEA